MFKISQYQAEFEKENFSALLFLFGSCVRFWGYAFIKNSFLRANKVLFLSIPFLGENTNV